MLAVAIFSGLVAFAELNFFQLSKSSYVTNIGMMHSLLGFVLSMLLVFRTIQHTTGGGKEESYWDL
jgi:putative membrane protein